MKKLSRKIMAVVLSMLMSIMMVATVYAQQLEDADFANIEEITNARTYVTENGVRSIATPYGMMISSVDMILTYKGHGEVDVYSEILCHESASKIRMKVYLEKWNESSSSWTTVDTKSYTWTSEEYGEDLSMAVVNYNVLGISAGRYRLRGAFSARALNSSLSEAWTHSTSALVIGSTTP